MAKPFKGVINLDVRDSTQDWSAFLAERAPETSPNVLYDDTGCAAWSRQGGRIEKPTLDRLAKDGLPYGQWRTTALRLDLGDGTRFPGYSSHIPVATGYDRFDGFIGGETNR